MRRLAVAGASITALLMAAACGGGGGNNSAPQGSGAAVDWNQTGPIEFWTGKDTTGQLKNLIDQFNKQNAGETVTLRELPESADAQRQQLIQNSQIKNAKMAVMTVDVVWTSEFAANGYLVALPPEQFPTEGMLKPAVDTGTYFNKLYAMPRDSNGGLLFYRKDLLDKYNLKPPTTFDEMKQQCDTIRKGENDSKLGCFAGQYQKYEGLTVNFSEAVNSAGGVVTDDQGKPNVNTPEAAKGLSTLVEMFKDGYIPKGAITWQEEQGRTAFQKGQLIFHRNWPYVYALAQKTDGSSEVAGKFGVAPLPGITVKPGVSSLGGGNLGIGTNAANKGTAAKFVKFMTSEEGQKAWALATSSAPTQQALYTDPQVVKKYPYMGTLLKSIQTAKPRPKVVKYGDVTLAIQDAAYSALQGETAPDAALSSLQSRLESLTK